MDLGNITKRIVFAATAALLCCAVAVGQTPFTPKAPEHPVTTEQVSKMMTITHMKDRMHDGMHAMILQQKQAMPYFPDGFWTDFEVEMDKVDWVTIATPVYQKFLSQEDADKVIAFYETDYGQRSLNSSMAVMLEMNAKGFEIGKDIGTRVGEKYAAEIQANMKKAQQQTVAPPPQK